MMRYAAVCAVSLAVLAAAWSAPDATIRDGAMEGQTTDHSQGKGQLITPDGWTPVNVDTGRGDRLSVEPSDRPGAGQCLHVKTFGSDAGVYQSITPLQKGKTYLVSAWVKALKGRMVVEAYSYHWGPAIMRRSESANGAVPGAIEQPAKWTQVVVGLTPIDEGAHLYLVAAPEAEFLIDDVQIRPATVQLSTPEALPYDFGGMWRYRLTVSRLPDDATPRPRNISLRSYCDEGHGRRTAGPQRRVVLPAGKAQSVEMEIGEKVEGDMCVEAVDSQTGDVLGGSPVVPLVGDPWAVSYPYKHALFASTGYQWPLRAVARHASPEKLRSLRATATLAAADGKVLQTIPSRLDGDALVMPLDGRGLPKGEYKLRVTVPGPRGRTAYSGGCGLAVLPPSPSEVTVAPDGQTLVAGKPFFPIGLYWVLADPAGWKPGPARKDADLKELRQVGFNTLHTYAFEHNDANDTDENALAYLDMAQEFGFKVMMGIRRDWYQGKELNAAAIEKRVKLLRDHPALLCWTLWDEPNFDTSTVPRVQAMYDIVNRIDPYHPAMPVFGGPGGRPFHDCADTNLFDCYPGRGNAGILPDVLKRAHDDMPDRPVWFVAQAFRSGTTNDSPLVTEQDMRLFWQYALAGGSKAIFWYSYGGDGKAWDSVKTTPENWENVKRIIGELAKKVGG